MSAGEMFFVSRDVGDAWKLHKMQTAQGVGNGGSVDFPRSSIRAQMGRSKHVDVSDNVVYPIVPNGFADHYP